MKLAHLREDEPHYSLLAGWTLAESATQDRKERFWICLAGIAPDLDGFGLPVDLVNEFLGRATTHYYFYWHRFLFHGLFGALVTMGIAAAAGVRRWKACLLVFLSFHLHHLTIYVYLPVSFLLGYCLLSLLRSFLRCLSMF